MDNKMLLLLIAAAGLFYVMSGPDIAEKRAYLKSVLGEGSFYSLLTTNEIDILYDAAYNYVNKGLPVPVDLAGQVNMILSKYGITS